MDKDSKGQRKMGDSGGIEQNDNTSASACWLEHLVS